MLLSRQLTVRALAAAAVIGAATAAGLGSAGSAGAWTLEEAAEPYKGTTIRTVGEALPPLEAMEKIKHEFEERTGIEVVIEMYEHSEAVNKVMLDLNSKRGRILGSEPKSKKVVVNALVPQAEIFTYSRDLRSQTQGRGTYTVTFDHFERVPPDIQAKVVEAYKKEKEEA